MSGTRRTHGISPLVGAVRATAGEQGTAASAEELIPPERLSGIGLVRAVWLEGLSAVGSETSGLAYFDEQEDVLLIVSVDPRKIRHVALERVTTDLAMTDAKDLGASFSVLDGQVLCTIRGCTQAGETYGEAALRAILALSRVERSIHEG